MGKTKTFDNRKGTHDGYVVTNNNSDTVYAISVPIGLVSVTGMPVQDIYLNPTVSGWEDRLENFQYCMNNLDGSGIPRPFCDFYNGRKIEFEGYISTYSLDISDLFIGADKAWIATMLLEIPRPKYP